MATYYLNADTGNDSGSGTSVSPWKTVAKAITVTVSGDTIYFQNSTAHYTWASAMFMVNLTLQGQSTAGCVLDGGAANVQWVVYTSCSLTVNNLRFTNAGVTASAGFFQGYTNGSSPTQALTLMYCQFDNLTIAAQCGVIGDRFNTICVIEYCVFFGITGASGTTWIISGGWINNLVFKGNTIYLAAGNNLSGIIWNAGSSGGNAAFVSCICQDASNSVASSTANPVTWTYSCLKGTNLTTGAVVGTGTLSTDPLFIDPTNGNFNLQPTSPCIDKGSL